MRGSCIVFGREMEYDFVSSWMRYRRIKNKISQESLSYGICSTSHLCYFENGKRKLREDIIEALLKKLGVKNLEELNDLGIIRLQFYNMINEIEALNFKGATDIYNELKSRESFLETSLYSMEFEIYKLTYVFFVEDASYLELKEDIKALDRIYDCLNEDLKYIYLVTTGKCIYKHLNYDEGIKRLEKAQKIKDTPWVNYFLGFAFCFNRAPLKGTYYFEDALKSYENNGKYINAIWCHNYLGICYCNLEIYDRAEAHYKAALNGANYFKVDKILQTVYINLSDLYLCKHNYEEGILWSEKAMNSGEAMNSKDNTLISASNYVEGCAALGKLEEVKVIFRKYLTEENRDSKYYNLLYFNYLSIFHFKEELFYYEITEKVLPYYENISYIDIGNHIKVRLIEHLESKRRYKEANKLYKELLKI